MKLNDLDIKQYQETYFDIYKKTISQDDAFVELRALVNFMETIYQVNNNNICKNPIIEVIKG